MSWYPSHWTREPLEERRLNFALSFEKSFQHCRTACEHYRISVATFYTWRKKLQLYGAEGLKRRKATGRNRRMSSQQESQLQHDLNRPATDFGFLDPCWTSPRVRDLIGLKFGIWYHPAHAYRILKRLGYSFQKPDRRAIERNELRVEQWIGHVIPDIQKKIEQGATLVFLDEAGFSLKTTTRKTWAPKGRTPILKARTNWEKRSGIGALTHNGRFFQHTTLGSWTGEGVASFLRHLLKWLSGDVLIVLDNGAIHKTAAVQRVLKEHPRLQLIFLPPYAPELNSIERVWAHVKHHILAGRLAQSLTELKRHLRSAWQRIRRLRLENDSRTGVWRESVDTAS